MYRQRSNTLLLLALLFASITFAGLATPAHAGIYDSNTEITYTEYWVDHEDFIADTCNDASPQKNQWYFEPQQGCQIPLDFTLTEDLSDITKIEIYIDLWRNHDAPRAEFKINNGAWRKPNVGSDWSRTPYVAEVPLGDFYDGDNVITFKGRGYHVHDIAFRVYGEDSDSAPTGSLGNVKDDSNMKALSSGGALNVNNDKLVLSATVGTGADLLEFHAYYDGYDEDNDGKFRDWHNLARNNWHPGGTQEFSADAALGGTINHVGTLDVSGAGTYSITWNIPHIINQSGVKFKIRVLDDSGNVREAAGGVSSNFQLNRNYPVVYFRNPSFEDLILWHDGDYSRTDDATIELPDLSDFDAGYMIGAYWARPNIYFNGDSISVFANRYNTFPTGSGDEWALSILAIGNTGDGYIPFSKIQSGQNTFTFENRNNTWGAFVEKPGPMIVLRGKNPPPTDSMPPALVENSPSAGETGVAEDAKVSVRLVDYNSGIDFNSFSMSVNSATNMPYNDSRISRSGDEFDMTFTYTPSSDFSEGETVTVTLDASDVANNAMATETFSFKITEPDFDAPVISNLQCVPGPDSLTIVWETDEPASGFVNYGPTSALGSNVSSSDFVTAHSLVIPGLDSETEYHYTVYSEDPSANGISEPVSGTLTCTTAGPSTLMSDDFNSCALDTNVWSYIDPLGLATITATGTQIQFDIPAGENYDVWTSGNNGARIMQPANDSPFEIDVKFESGITDGKQIQGVIIEQDADTYLRIGFGLDNSSKVRLYVFSLDGNSGTELLSGNGRPLNAAIDPNGPLYLRVWRRSSTEWTVFYSGDGSTWLQGGGYEFNQAINVTSIGAFGGNATGANPYTVVLDYFFRTDLPISPEDGTALQLGTTVSPPSVGNIYTNASCGNPIELTAEPIPGWSFDGWSSLQGSVSNTVTNPISVTYPFDEVITANFVQNFYELFATAEDGVDGMTGGIVTVGTPPGPNGYEYDALVELSALPATGWEFSGWGGDATGTELQTTVTMTNNRSVTANFSPVPYAVDVTVTGLGSVTIDPEPGPYTYNDVITLTVSADPGSTFEGWGGDLSGTATTENITIDGSKSVTALFTQDQYSLTVQTSGSGMGSVSVLPDSSSFIYGDVVTMTAAAEVGSNFIGWSGAGLSTNDSTVSVTMTQSEMVTAEFEAIYYAISVGALEGGSIVITEPASENGYVHNELVTLTALPDSGYQFDGWTAGLTGSTSPVVLNITETMAVGALFSLIPDDVVTYELVVTASEGGSVTPMGGTYAEGTDVTILATADEGFRFVEWTDAGGNRIAETTTIEVPMISDVEVKANFAPKAPSEFVLTKNKIGNGDIISTPSGSSFAPGAMVELEAMPSPGWAFAGWSGDVEGTTAKITVTMDADTTATATFTQNRYALSTSIVGNGSAELSAPADASGYVYGESVTMTASADEGSTFAGWDLGDGRTTMDNPAVLTVEESLTVTATFVEADVVVSGMSIGVEGQGEVTISPEKAAYTQDEEITLTAVEQSGWTFVRWESTEPLASGSESDITITVKAVDNLNVRAVFEQAMSITYLPVINN